MEIVDNPVVVIDGTPISSYNPEFNNFMIDDRTITSSGYLSEVYAGREFRKYVYKNATGELVKLSPWLEYLGQPIGLVNDPPIADNVRLVGRAVAGETLTCQYDFKDSDGDIEGDSIIAWYYTRNKNVPYTIIDGYSSGSLIIPGNALFDCYVKCGVTPRSANGATSDIEYFSQVVGPIPYSYQYPQVKIGFDE